MPPRDQPELLNVGDNVHVDFDGVIVDRWGGPHQPVYRVEFMVKNTRFTCTVTAEMMESA